MIFVVVSKPPVSKSITITCGFDTPFAKNAQVYSTNGVYWKMANSVVE